MGKAKPRLGRGLSSLVGQLAEPPTVPTTDGTERSTELADLIAPEPAKMGPGASLTRRLPVELIDENPYQPRSHYDPQHLDELVASIQEHGVIQPIVVRPHEHRYQLIAGQRRLDAARRAELDTIPALIRHASDEEVLEVALIENIHREDLNCVDRALAYKRYQDTFGLSAEKLAERLGQERPTVANYLRLLTLPEEVLELLRADRLTMGHARALAGLDNASLQIHLAVRIAQQDLSVRQAEALVARTKSPERHGRTKHVDKPPNILDLEQQMTRALTTRVQIQSGRKKGSGKIIIEFYGLDDFDQIFDRICGAERDPL